jgi:hypothetical protein
VPPAKLSAAVSAAALAAGVLLLAGVSDAEAAAQKIQVKAPAVRVCINKVGGIKVGVRWISGPRRYQVRVYDPSGKIVLVRRGLATHRWEQWTLRPTLGGSYRTVYTLAGRALRYRTQSLGCGG